MRSIWLLRLSSRAVLAPLLPSSVGDTSQPPSHAQGISSRTTIAVALPSSSSTLSWSAVVDGRSCLLKRPPKPKNCLSSSLSLSRPPFEPLLF
ncbi:hypothetical protein FJTKL_04300 [Diaporthe vaccinii]|uniref:Secreted protein n=1 Tax=Diaporthe vaccinii TaxID=105482 RepID=A0ABR4F0X5_9PEZI